MRYRLLTMTVLVLLLGAVGAGSAAADPPTTSIDDGPADSALIADADPAFTFSSSEPLATFVCTFDGVVVVDPCTSPAHFPAAPVADGPHTFAVFAVDELLGPDPVGASRSFTVDTQPPTVTIDSGPTGATNDATPTFTFTAEALATTQCRYDANPYTACTSPTTATTLPDGPHQLHVRATDTAGNTTETTRSFTVDTQPPTVTIDSGPTGATNDATPTFTFTAEALATTQCRYDANPYTACTSPTTPTTLPDGPHQLHVRATDTAGNTTETTRSFTVDTQPPTVTIDSGPTGATNDATPTFTFTAEALATTQCRYDANPYTACTSPTTATTLPDGPHQLHVRATDTAGNTTETTRSFTVDTTKPTAAVTGGPTGTTADRRPSLSFTTTDPGAQATGVVTVECRFDANAYAACTSPATPATDLPDGPHQFDVRATDAAGNLSDVASRSFTVASGLPGVQVTSGPVGDTGLRTPAFGFTATAAAGAPLAAVECRFDSEAFGPCTSATTHVRATPLADGPHTFEVRVTNDASLVATATRAFVVHSGAPAAAFDVAPVAPQTVEPVTFTATSTDADGTITLNEWDLDNDGTFEATGATASRSFRAAGRYTVRLRSSDQYGASSVAQRTIDVGNRPPIAAFAISTASPLVGAPVTFIATSSDADGPRPAAAWDLGGGSAFADGASDSVTRAFDRPGSYTVRLRATDADGATDIVSRTITVAAAPAAKASLLSPAPIIRIAGAITAQGVSVRVLSVSAPRGARVEVLCSGRSCPAARRVRVQGRSTAFRTFARRLRAGVVLQIRVTMPGAIGKYTKFVIRRSAAPLRTDRCLNPGDTTPVRCSS